MSLEKPYLIIVQGPTGVGKTDVALSIAKQFDTEIISADSRQIFRELMIGTAKPTPKQLKEVKHHFISHISIETDYSAGEFEREAIEILEEIFKRKKVAVVCGGSGLYIKSLLEGIDELPRVEKPVLEALENEYSNEGLDSLLDELRLKDFDYWNDVDRKNPRRIIRALSVIRSSGKTYSGLRKGIRKDRTFKVIKIGLELPREDLYAILDDRVDNMIKFGLFEEAEKLFNKRNLNSLQTVGYQEIFGYLEGKYDKSEAIRLLKRNTRRYAKRQLTWFRKDEEIKWFEPGQVEEIISHIESEIKD